MTWDPGSREDLPREACSLCVQSAVGLSSQGSLSTRYTSRMPLVPTRVALLQARERDGRSGRFVHEMMTRRHPGEILDPDRPKFHLMENSKGTPKCLTHPVEKTLGRSIYRHGRKCAHILRRVDGNIHPRATIATNTPQPERDQRNTRVENVDRPKQSK